MMMAAGIVNNQCNQKRAVVECMTMGLIMLARLSSSGLAMGEMHDCGFNNACLPGVRRAAGLLFGVRVGLGEAAGQAAALLASN
jgi:hypothetical protein